MADSGLLHTAELLKTALPFIDARSRLTLDLLLKLFELIACLNNFRTNNIAACNYDENEEADMESLLNKIRPKCNEKEAVFVDKMLSIFQAKKVFEMYNSYMEVMNTMQGFEGFSKEAANSDFASNIMNNFAGFDFSSVDLFSIFGGNKEDNKDDSEDSSSYEEATYYESSTNHEDKSYYDDLSNHDNKSYYDDKSNHDDSSNYSNKSNYNNILYSEKNGISHNDNTDKTSESNNDDGDMFESLKSMISPDQMGTFERLRMLFESQSYDDNSKSDENKE